VDFGIRPAAADSVAVPIESRKEASMPKKRTQRQRRQAQQRARVRRRREADAQAFQAAKDRMAASGRGGPASAAYRGWDDTFCENNYYDDPYRDGVNWDSDPFGAGTGAGAWRYGAEQQRVEVAEGILRDTVAAILGLRSPWPVYRLDEALAEHQEAGTFDELAQAASVVLLAWLYLVQLWFGPEEGGDIAVDAVAWVGEYLGGEEAEWAMPFARWLGDKNSRPSYDSPPDELVAGLLPNSLLLFAGLAATAGGGNPGWLDGLDFSRGVDAGRRSE
jgi:hypothetical protein